MSLPQWQACFSGENVLVLPEISKRYDDGF